MRTIFWLENLKGRELGITGRRWGDNSRMDLRELGWEVDDWIHLAQNRNQWRVLLNMVMKLGFHKGAGGNFLKS
jgi:hypothetical protein